MEQIQSLTGNNLLIQYPWMIWVLVATALWTIPWKGVALWKSARHGHKWWFIALLIVNSLAILEILYIFVFAKKHKVHGE